MITKHYGDGKQVCNFCNHMKAVCNLTIINRKCIKCGLLEFVKYLFEVCHAYVETKDNDGNTPIITASHNGNLEIVKYLMKHVM